MRGMDVLQVGAVGLVFATAGAVKGVTGMGLPTVAMSLLGLWMTPLEAAALLVLPSMATNVAQCRGAYLRRLAATLWPTWLALAVVTVLLPVPASAAAASNAHRLLGAVLVLYGVWGLWRPRLPVLTPCSRWVGLAAGGVTGAVTAATAVFVVPLVPYLQALRLDKDQMVQALGLSFTVATLALALRLQASGEQALFTAHAVLALAAAAAGLRLGEHIRARISAAVFQRALFVVFVFLGVANVAQGM
jgi:uncharacterized membrane protein YfcA